MLVFIIIILLTTGLIVIKINFENLFIDILTIIFSFITILLIFGFLMFIMIRQEENVRFEVEYELTQLKIERLDNDSIINGDLGSLRDTYDKVARINSEILLSRKFKDNIWVSWFYNPYYAQFDLLEIEK